MKRCFDLEFAFSRWIMARPAKPWYWKDRKTWCVYHKGEKILLGPDRDEAFRLYHEIMAKPVQERQPLQQGAVVAILDDFLTWTEENRAPKTYTRYRDFLQSFVSQYGRMEVGKLSSPSGSTHTKVGTLRRSGTLLLPFRGVLIGQ
jgi:hypothetical protein